MFCRKAYAIIPVGENDRSAHVAQQKALVHEVYKAISIPIIGMGGIMTGEDAAEFLLAGASALMVGTATVAEPDAMIRILGELNKFLDENGAATARELTGALEY